VPGSALVTGGRGFVGAWLCRRLLERGDPVVSLDRGGREGRPSALELLGIAGQVTEVEGDLLDPELVRATLSDHHVDTVFHLAAQTLVGRAADSPSATFDVNVRGTWTLL
jgi:CDP-glucose 4,6-dehydratase